MRRFRIPRVVGTEARGEHRVTTSHVASRAPRGQSHAHIAVEDRRGRVHADCRCDQHPRRVRIAARRIAHRLETRPVLPEKLPPVRKQAVALAPFQIGEANRRHPWLLAHPLLQAERLHPLSSWRMRTLRLAESSPWWASTSGGWAEGGKSC